MVNTGYPGVIRSEEDLSQINVVDNSTVIATIGLAKKGLVNSRVLVKSPNELINTFGTPLVSGGRPENQVIDYGIYAAIEGLKESSNVYFTRLTNGSERYSAIGVSGTYTGVASGASIVTSAKPTTEALANYPNGYLPNDNGDIGSSNTPLDVYAVGPGVYGDNIAIRVITPYASAVAGLSADVDWMNNYDEAADVSGVNAKWKKIFKVQVYTKQSYESFGTLFASISASPDETFYVSNDYTVLDNSGNAMFADEVINGKSSYIYVKSNGVMPAYTTSYLALTGGADSTLTTTADHSTGWSIYSNKDIKVDVLSPVPVNGNSSNAALSTSTLTAINGVLSKRMDFISPVQVGSIGSKTKNALIQDSVSVTAGTVSNPSYFAKYAGWQLVLDPYNSLRVWIPNSIFAAAIYARTDRVAFPWEAPAGTDLGGIPSSQTNLKLDESELGEMYKTYNINTARRINGVQYIWGQKTAQLKKTARDRINVRRMLLTVENNVESILSQFLFKGNTDRNRERIVSLITNYMTGVKIDGGVEEFRVVVDSTNNTSTTIAQNILNVDLYVKPVQTIEFINLKLVISADSVSVGEA